MGRILYEQAFVNSPEQVTLKFRFQSAGTGTTDPDFIVPANCGVTDIDQSAAGVWAITLTEKYPVFIGLTGHVMCASGVGLGQIVQAAVADYVASTGVLTVRTVDPYTDASPAAADIADNDWVYIEATFCRKSNMAPSGAI